MKLLLATHNEHKRREFERLLGRSPAGEGWELALLDASVSLPPEDGETFAENAFGKARAAASATGSASIADDSGIAAGALGGAPGVRSARYAGEGASDQENLAKLLRGLRDPGETYRGGQRLELAGDVDVAEQNTASVKFSEVAGMHSQSHRAFLVEK